jgi:HEAT repeat protein
MVALLRKHGAVESEHDPNKAIRAVEELAKSLRTGNAKGRYMAAAALGFYGRNAKPAVPALLDALKDRDKLVRETAAQSLKHIDPDAAAKAGIK